MVKESYIQSLFSERLGGDRFGKDTTIYKFEKIKRAKKEAKKNNPGKELIDLGVGEPDEMAFPGIVNMLALEANKHENRGYTDNGIQDFKDAASSYMENVFGVSGLDPSTEIIHSIGSKPALAMFPAAFINKGDVTLITVPGYPIIGTHTGWFGGDVYKLPLKEENKFYPDLSIIPDNIKKRAKLLYINYPNNPTGAPANKSFFKQVVAFAKENDVIVVHDAAYAALTHSGAPLSFLSIDGAKDVGVEIHSMSKAYNMTGWRLAFVAGNPLIISGFASVKDNYDSGQFAAIQKAGIYALHHPEYTEKINEKYKRRLKKLVTVLKGAGLKASLPGGSFYLYIEAPKGIAGSIKFSSGEDFSQYLIKEKLISTVPWDDEGAFVRFSVTFEAKGEKEEDRILDEVAKRFSNINFVF